MWRFYRQLWPLIAFICCPAFLLSQGDHSMNMYPKIKEHHELMAIYPDSAFLNMDKLMEEAVRQGDRQAELSLLSSYCWYYERKSDFVKMMESAKNLEEKATLYKDTYSKVLAHSYFLQAYSNSELYDKAIAEFEAAKRLLAKEDPNDPIMVVAKASVYSLAANIYINRNEHKKAASILIMVADDLDRIAGEFDQAKGLQFSNYANLASVYAEFNPDSAEYFVKKSIELKPRDKGEDVTMFLNYLTLGEVFRKRKDVPKAILNYRKAEELTPQNGDVMNLRTIYEGLIEIYEMTGNVEEAENYKQKLNDIRLEIAAKQKSSLHKIIETTESRAGSSGYSKWFIFAMSALILVLLGLLIYYLKKNKKLAVKEKVSQQHLEETILLLNDQSNSNLIDLLKNNDPAFMNVFEQTYPDFIPKILAVTPNLTLNEIEFCAILKLNLSTKEIAQIKYYSLRTVQNKKNKLRKKMDIPSRENIYKWFTEL